MLHNPSQQILWQWLFDFFGWGTETYKVLLIYLGQMQALAKLNMEPVHKSWLWQVDIRYIRFMQEHADISSESNTGWQALLLFPAGLNQYSHKPLSWKWQNKLPCANMHCWMPRVREREDRGASLSLSISSTPCTYLLRKTGKHSLRARQEPWWHKSSVSSEPALALTTGWTWCSRTLESLGFSP